MRHPNIVTERRYGRFRVARAALEFMPTETLLRLYSHFVILRAEYLMPEECFVYDAASSLFTPVAEGQKIPEYEIIASPSVVGGTEQIGVSVRQLEAEPILTPDEIVSRLFATFRKSE